MARDRRHVAARDGLIDRAIKRRQITASSADEYRRLYDENPEGVIRLLTAPVEKGGLLPGITAAGMPHDLPPTEYPREWIGERVPSGSVAFEDAQAATAGVTAGVPLPREARDGEGSALPGGARGTITLEP